MLIVPQAGKEKGPAQHKTIRQWHFNRMNQMNYFLELYHINEYFRRVSSMDTERIAAAESIGLEFSPIKQMVRNLIMTEIPEYYLDESSVEGLQQS